MPWQGSDPGVSLCYMSEFSFSAINVLSAPNLVYISKDRNVVHIGE